MRPAPATRVVCALALAACLLGAGSAFARNDDHERLAARLDQLAADPQLGPHATAALALARTSLARLEEAGRSEREQWVYVTERRIESARASAEAGVLDDQHDQLQRENDRLQLALARRDAAQARAELERQRLQAQIRAEETERMRQEMETARVEGEQASLAAESARAEAEQAKRIARAQANAAALSRKEAELAAALEGQGDSAPAPKKKPARKKK